MRTILHVDLNNFYASVECYIIRRCAANRGSRRRPGQPARHNSGQKHAGEKVGRKNRRSHLAGQRKSA